MNVEYISTIVEKKSKDLVIDLQYAKDFLKVSHNCDDAVIRNIIMSLFHRLCKFIIFYLYSTVKFYREVCERLTPKPDRHSPFSLYILNSQV